MAVGMAMAAEGPTTEHKVVSLLALTFGVTATALGMNEHTEHTAYQRELEERAAILKNELRRLEAPREP
jgi:hypothetical protein